MTTENTAIIDSIRSALVELNSDISEQHLEAKAFFTDFDTEFDAMVAHVVFVVAGETVEDNLESLDTYCAMANSKLDPFVVFTNCIYRTREQYENDFKNDDWEHVLHEVNNG